MTSKIHKINKKLKRFNKRLNQINNNLDNQKPVYNNLDDFNQIKIDLLSNINDFNIVKSELTTIMSDFNVVKSELTTIMSDFNVVKSELTTIMNDFKNVKSEMVYKETSVETLVETSVETSVETLVENLDEILETSIKNSDVKNVENILDINDVVKNIPPEKNEYKDKLVLREDILDEMNLEKDNKKRMIIYTCLVMDINKLKNVEMFDIDIDKINAIKMLMEKTNFDINNWEVNKLLSVNKQKYFSEYIQNVFEYKMKVKLETELQIKQIMFKLLKSISLGKYLIKIDDSNNSCNYSFDKSFIKKYNTFIKKLKNNNTHSVNTHSVNNTIKSIIKTV
jgi:hypothetical protein